MCRHFRHHIQEVQGQVRHERAVAWQAWTQDAWRNDRRKIFEFVGSSQGGVKVLRKEDGTYTGSLKELDELLLGSWLPIFRKYEVSPEPAWEDFHRRFGPYIPRAQTRAESVLTPEMLREVLKKMDPTTSVGVDGWSVAELRCAPPQLLQRLCDLFASIEAHGRWPASLAVGLITPVPKGTKFEALHMRPITVMPVLYRLWAGAHMRMLIEWMDSWLTRNVASYRPDLGCEDVWLANALEIEAALLEGRPITGLNLDFAKCFDLLPHSILLNSAEEVGLPENVLSGLRAMYAQLERRFKLGPVVGEPFVSTNGILQRETVESRRGTPPLAECKIDPDGPAAQVATR